MSPKHYVIITNAVTVTIQLVTARVLCTLRKRFQEL